MSIETVREETIGKARGSTHSRKQRNYWRGSARRLRLKDTRAQKEKRLLASTGVHWQRQVAPLSKSRRMYDTKLKECADSKTELDNALAEVNKKANMLETRIGQRNAASDVNDVSCEGLRGGRVGPVLGGAPQGFALRRKSSGRQEMEFWTRPCNEIVEERWLAPTKVDGT